MEAASSWAEGLNTVDLINVLQGWEKRSATSTTQLPTLLPFPRVKFWGSDTERQKENTEQRICLSFFPSHSPTHAPHPLSASIPSLICLTNTPGALTSLVLTLSLQPWPKETWSLMFQCLPSFGKTDMKPRTQLFSYSIAVMLGASKVGISPWWRWDDA